MSFGHDLSPGLDQCLTPNWLAVIALFQHGHVLTKQEKENTYVVISTIPGNKWYGKKVHLNYCSKLLATRKATSTLKLAVHFLLLVCSFRPQCLIQLPPSAPWVCDSRHSNHRDYGDPEYHYRPHLWLDLSYHYSQSTGELDHDLWYHCQNLLSDLERSCSA